MDPNHLNTIKEFGYLPVGLGKKSFSSDWLRDNIGENISEKNIYYGEYTFHYWLWKNYFEKIENSWIGFCQYRKFWTVEKEKLLPNSLIELKPLILKNIPIEYNSFDTILGEEYYINQFRFMKFLKRGIKIFLKNPSAFLSKNKRNIKFHFDMWHGSFYLDKAIELLDYEDKEDFKKFVDTQVSFNPHNMFICRSKKILEDYYKTVFPWLKRCEEVIGFQNLSGYGQTRIYGFLAERFMSYWFKKNTKYKTMPILFYDIKNS